jgi:hypothetical protein
MILFLLSGIFPPIGSIPTETSRVTKTVTDTMRSIADGLITKAKEERENLSDAGLDRSILGALGVCP